MSIYKFLDKDERLTKRDFNSFKEACDFAKANNLTCMTMTYQDFMTAFMEKVASFESHYNFSRLQEMANQANEQGGGTERWINITSGVFPAPGNQPFPSPFRTFWTRTAGCISS